MEWHVVLGESCESVMLFGSSFSRQKLCRTPDLSTFFLVRIFLDIDIIFKMCTFVRIENR